MMLMNVKKVQKKLIMPPKNTGCENKCIKSTAKCSNIPQKI